MQFSYPFAFFGLLLALPVVALYLLRVRPRPRAVSTVLFWQQVIPETRPRRWWQRLRHPLSLLLQLLILALVVLALADPFWPDRQSQRVLLVVLDNSASMQATDVPPSRWELAQRDVRQLIEGMGPRDQMALLSGGTPATLWSGLTPHKRDLLKALEAISASDGPGQLAAAIQLARRLPVPTAESQLFVITDPGGRLEAQDHAGDTPVRWLVHGSTVDNVAITQFQVRRQTLDPIGLECLVELTSFTAQPREVQLWIERDGELQDVIPWQLQPQQPSQKVLTYVSAEGGMLSAHLDLEDALATDNQAFARLLPRAVRSITLATPGNPYLERVLAAIPLVDLKVVNSWPEPTTSGTISLVHALPLDRLPEGRSMVVQPVGDNAWWRIGGPVADPLIVSQRQEASLLTHLQLAELPVVGSRQMQLVAPAEVLAATPSGDPVYAIIRHERGETLLLNVDLQASDFAWRTAFPLLMSNAVNWLAGQTADYQASYATGQTIRWGELHGGIVGSATESVTKDRSAGGTSAWELTSPRGVVSRWSAAAQPVRLGPLDQAGVWRLGRLDPAGADTATDRPAWQLACNLVNPGESDLRAGSPPASVTASFGPGGQPVWCYLLAAAMVLLAIEWWLYQRRWIG